MVELARVGDTFGVSLLQEPMKWNLTALDAASAFRSAVKRGLELMKVEPASKFVIPTEIQQMIDQGLVKDCTEEQRENIPAFIAHSEKTTEPLVGLYKNDDRWEILVGIDGRESYDYDSVAEAVLGFKNQLEYWLAAEAREQIHLRLFGESK